MTSAIYEVYLSPQPGHTYRRLIERDGKALTAEELAKEDRREDRTLRDACLLPRAHFGLKIPAG